MHITIEIRDGDANVTTRVSSSESSATAQPQTSSAPPPSPVSLQTPPESARASSGASDAGPAPTFTGDVSHEVLPNTAIVTQDAPAPFSTPGTGAPSGADEAAGAAPGSSEPIVSESIPAYPEAE
jgi:hypothetical protein